MTLIPHWRELLWHLMFYLACFMQILFLWGRQISFLDKVQRGRKNLSMISIMTKLRYVCNEQTIKVTRVSCALCPEPTHEPTTLINFRRQYICTLLSRTRANCFWPAWFIQGRARLHFTERQTQSTCTQIKRFALTCESLDVAWRVNATYLRFNEVTSLHGRL